MSTVVVEKLVNKTAAKSDAPKELPAENLGGIADDVYLRKRLEPRPGEPLYLHLSDLRMALKPYQTDQSLMLLDFGCGGSPYRSLFPNSTYERADIAGVADLDYEISTTADKPCTIGVEDNRYDFVLSNQVLEHVPDPMRYLTEAYRVLKPGGRLLLTTHGMFEDHGCPYDFHRWTSDGLQADLQTTGFDLSQMTKLTTGPRAAVFLMQQHRRTSARTRSLGLWVWWFKLMQKLRSGNFDRQCDRSYSDCRVVNKDLEAHRIYIGLLALAEKPSGDSTEFSV